MFDFDDLREDDGCSCNNGENGFNTTRQKQVVVEEEETVVDKGVFPVRLGKFRKVNVEGGESNEVGETSSSNLDARRCYSMGSYQYVVGDLELRVALNHNKGHHDNTTRLITKGSEHDAEKLSLEGDMEAKKISNVSKGDSFSISKIWLWPKKGNFSSSLEGQRGLPSYLNTADLHRGMRRETDGV